MSKGGSTTSKVQIPEWLENAAIENINRARDVQQIGFTPYYGPDLAAFTPMQTQAMQATGQAAEAFGLAPSGFDPMAGMPQPQQFAGGLMGYSSAPLFEQSVDMLRQRRPAQAQALEGLFIDPVTGEFSQPNNAPMKEQGERTSRSSRSRSTSMSRPMTPSLQTTGQLDIYDNFDDSIFPMYDFNQDQPNVLMGDTRYLLDTSMTPTMNSLGAGSKVFNLDGDLVEDTLTRPNTGLLDVNRVIPKKSSRTRSQATKDAMRRAENKARAKAAAKKLGVKLATGGR